MKVVAIIICDDNIYFGGKKTINSLKYFNPNIEVILYGTAEINKLKIEYNCDDIRFLGPVAIRETWLKYKPDLLIKIGADCLVLDNLDELENLSFDVAAARNDPDQVGDRDETQHRPLVIRGVPNWEWVNADFVCMKSRKFVEEWYNQTMRYWKGEEKPYDREYRGDCQLSLNVVFRLGGFKTVILDPKGSEIVYGASGNYCDGNNSILPDSIKMGQVNNWSSWRYIYFNGEKSIMPKIAQNNTKDKIVKVLHQSGGFQPNKLYFDLFNDEYRKYLQKITGFEN